MENKNYKKYIHIDNGGIQLEVDETEYGDYTISIETSYCGYPHTKISLVALPLEHLEEISTFLSKTSAKIKLKR